MFWKKKNDIELPNFLDANLRYVLKEKKSLIIQGVDEIINETLNLDKNQNKIIQHISPLIISPSSTGKTELDILKEKLKKVEEELSEEKAKNNNKIEAFKTIQIIVEIPKYIIESSEMNEDGFIRMYNPNEMRIAPISDSYNVKTINNIESFLNIKVFGFEELKSQRKYLNNKTKCIMTFGPVDEVSYYADNEEITFKNFFN